MWSLSGSHLTSRVFGNREGGAGSASMFVMEVESLVGVDDDVGRENIIYSGFTCKECVPESLFSY